MRSLRILLTNIETLTWTGTIIVLRDFALKYAERGHRPVVWSPRPGTTTVAEFRRLGIEVVDALSDLESPPDIIHGHHNISTALALATFPGVPAVMFGHSVDPIDYPLLFARVWRYLAVSRINAETMTRHGADPARIVFFPNAVELRRFPPRPGPLPSKPVAAMAFTKTREQVAVVRHACVRRGMTFTSMGAGGDTASFEPERTLLKQDLVFATARCAIEAACAGAAVIVGDARGFAGMVTTRNFKALRSSNFGRPSLIHPATPALIAREIDRFDPEDAAEVTHLMREDADLDKATDRMEAIFSEALAAGFPPEWTEDDQRALSSFLGSWPVPGPEREAWKDEFVQLTRFVERNRTLVE